MCHLFSGTARFFSVKIHRAQRAELKCQCGPVRPLRGVRVAYWSRTDVLIIASRSDLSVFFLARFYLGLHEDTFT